MIGTRSSTEIWLIGSPKSVLIFNCLPTNGDVFQPFFYFLKSHNLKKVEAAKQVTKVVSDIWIKSGIPMKSNWLHCKQLLGMHDKWEKLKKNKNRESNTERSKRKKFYEDLQKLFDIAAEYAEELIYADRLKTKAAKDEDAAFLCDQKQYTKNADIIDGLQD